MTSQVAVAMAAELFSRTTEEVLIRILTQPDLESRKRRDLWVTFQEAPPLKTSRCGRGSGEPQDQFETEKKVRLTHVNTFPPQTHQQGRGSLEWGAGFSGTGAGLQTTFEVSDFLLVLHHVTHGQVASASIS